MMSGYIIRKLYYGEEESYGEPASVTDYLGIVRTWNAGGELIHHDVRIGGRETYNRIPIGLNFSPTIEFLPISGKFLKYVFGKVTDSGSSPPYDHLIEVGNDLKSITVEAVRIGDTKIAERAVGVLVDSAEISIEADGLATVSLECRAKSVSIISPYTEPSIDFPSRLPYRFNDMKLYVDGVEYASIVSASISFNNNLEEMSRRGDYISGFKLTKAEYEAELKLFFEDTTLLEKFLSKESSNVELILSHQANDYIKFNLNNCLVEAEAELPFEAEVLMQTIHLYPKKITVEVRDNIESY